MPAYRLYLFDGLGKRIEHAQWVAADNDADAIQFARDKRYSTNCEVWERDRLVARVPAFELPSA